MKIRIDEVGYEDYTGQLGLVEFLNGVSVNEVSAGEINRMSAVVRVVDVESDEQIGSLTEFEKNMDYNFPVEEAMSNPGDPAFVDINGEIPVTELDADGNPIVKLDDEGNPIPPAAPETLQTPVLPASDQTKSPVYTREQLEALADKEGIAGLRAVAETFNVKGTKIVDLIQDILDQQALKAQ